MIKIGDIVGQYLVERNKKNNRDNTKFHPSSIGYCTRKTVYVMSGYPGAELSPQSLSIFENGHSFHNRMEHWFDKAGILIAPELPIKNDELNISGRTDAVINNPNSTKYQYLREVTLVDFNDKVIYTGPDNEIALVELKSINYKGFNRVRNEGPKEEHVAQLQLYMFLTGIHHGIIFYENKNDQETLEFWIEYDPVLVAKLIDKIKVINAHVAGGTVPDREGTRSSFKCRYCDYQEICWSESLIIPSLDDII